VGFCGHIRTWLGSRTSSTTCRYHMTSTLTQQPSPQQLMALTVPKRCMHGVCRVGFPSRPCHLQCRNTTLHAAVCNCMASESHGAEVHAQIELGSHWEDGGIQAGDSYLQPGQVQGLQIGHLSCIVWSWPGPFLDTTQILPGPGPDSSPPTPDGGTPNFFQWGAGHPTCIPP